MRRNALLWTVLGVTFSLTAASRAGTVDVRFEVGAVMVSAPQDAPPGVTPLQAAFLGRRMEVGRGLRIVHREVPPGMSPLEAAIRASVAGPTADEAAMGLFSHLPPDSQIVTLEITPDTVSIDFSREALFGITDHTLESVFDQFKATIGDFPDIRTIRLTCQGQPLSSYLPPAPRITPAPAGTTPSPSAAPQDATPSPLTLNALAGRIITIGPSHGRFWNGSGWFWQRSDPCNLGEAVLEDTNSIRLMQFLYQYLIQDGAQVLVPRDLTETDCCHSAEGLNWWKMAARYWLEADCCTPASVWDSSTDDLSDDIRARPLFADYYGSHIYIAHHTNAGGGGTARGTETYRDTAMEHPAQVANSLTLANNVHGSIINANRELWDPCWNDRGVKDSAGAFGEIRIPNQPAILIELGFHDGCNPSGPTCGGNPIAADTIALTNNYFKSVAEWGVYRGICQYFGVTPGWDRYSDELVSENIPASMNAGQSYNIGITYRNRGVLWSNPYNFRLGAVGDSDPFTGFNRVNLTGETRAGQTYTFNFIMTAPPAGVYTTDWQMVRDGVAWFGAVISKTVTVISSGGDQGVPSQPTNLIAFATSSTSVQLNWTASTDDVAVVGYDIRRNNSIIGSSLTNAYTDNTAAANTAYTYEVRARDAVPNYSGWSNSASVTTPAPTPPDFIVESRTGGQNNPAKYSEPAGALADTTAKSSAPGCTGGIGGRYGSANQPVVGVKRALFKYDVPVTGEYEVFVTSGNQSLRNSNVQTIISHAGGNTTTSFNEPASTNLWTSMGKFNFNAGANTGVVELNNNNGNAAGSNVNVDSAKWSFVPPAPSPGPNRTICPGGTTAISASVGTGQTVDWYTGSCGGTLIASGSPSVNVSPASNTTYYARGRVVSNGVVSSTCSTVTVSIVSPPGVSAPTPADPTVCAGDNVNFSVNASGTGPFSYQWKRGAVNVGTNSDTLALVSVSQNDAGTYTCVVTGPGCAVTSSGSTLTVVGPCNDNDACTIDTCDSQTLQCVFTPVSVDDGNPCTVDSCDPQTGQTTHVPISCDDGDACTVDSCDSQTGQCAHAPLNCDDQNVCNGTETCDSQTGCVPGTPLNCDDGNACTTDGCDPQTGCTHVAVDCDDSDSCTTDTCDPQLGCIHLGLRTIAGRSLFYNNSFYDSAASACNTLVGQTCNDDTAVATDKVALNPGGTAGTSNYISYSRGINGLMIDVAPDAGCNPLPAGPLAASSFDFKVANSANLGSYVAAAAPLSIEVIPSGGAGGSDRIKIIWADNAIPNIRWLRVVVKSNANGGQLDLAADSIFYYGLAIGDSLTPGSTRVVVSSTDEIDARNHPHNSLSRVPVAANSTYAVANAPDARYDYDKSSQVTSADEIIARHNPTNTATGLLLLNPAP